MTTVSSPSRAHVPTLALSVTDAARSFGMSTDAFREHVLPHVHIVYLGRLPRIAVKELDHFLAEHGVRLASP
jgi:hypothetical protein